MEHSTNSALERLLGQTRWLRALARELGGPAADDLVQSAWVVTLERPPRVSPAAASWFARVLASLARARRREERARGEREERSARAEAQDSAAEIVARAESQRWLVGHVLALDEPYRSSILQRYFEGLSAAEIARRAGVPDATVRKRLERGLAELRGRLKGERGRELGAWLVPLMSAPQYEPAPVASGAIGKTGVLVASVLVVMVLGLGWWQGRVKGAPAVSAGLSSSAASVMRASAPEGSSAVLAPVTASSRTALQELAKALAPDELRGRVVTSAGEPVGGARLRAEVPLNRQWPRSGSWLEDLVRPAGATRTDAEGRFSLAGLEPRALDLWIEAEGFARERRPWVLPESELVLVLARPARLVGRLLREPEGTPASGVEVHVQRGPLPGDFLQDAKASTDADGRFVFESLVPGYYSISAEDDGLGGLVLEEGQTATFEQRLKGRSFLTGRVEDARDGHSIAGARVWSGIDRNPVVSDADGEFRLEGLPLGRALNIARASASGYSEGQAPVLWSLDESGAEVVIRLHPGRRCTGRVVMASGEPLANAYVTASARASEWRRDDRHARTGPDGSFELADLRAELRHTLLVSAEGHASAVFDFPACELEEDTLELGDLALEPPTLVGGVVVNRTGHALFRHPVFLRGEPAARDRLGPLDGGEGYLARWEQVVQTDELGRFLFTDLPEGAWMVSADRKGWWKAGELEFMLASGEQRTGLRLEVDDGLALAGSVLDDQERPLAGVTVELYVTGEEGRRLYVYTDERGRFAFHGLAAGDYTLAAGGWTDEFVDARHEGVPAGTLDVRLVLERSVAQRVRVVDRDGDPLPGAFVGVVAAQGSAKLDPCDHDGFLTLHVSARTPFALRAHANRHFDPDNLTDPFFLDEQGNLLPEMSAECTGLTASDKVIELVIPGLP